MRHDLSADDAVALLIEEARARGADQADAMVRERSAIEASVRLGAVEDVERSESRSVGLRVFVGRRIGAVASEDWSPSALKDLAARAVAFAQAAPEDPYANLADEAALVRDAPDLDLRDDVEPDADALIARARETEAIARDGAEIVNSEGASASRSTGRTVLADHRGFRVEVRGGSHALAVGVLAERDGKKERGGEGRAARHISDVPAPQAIGEEAAMRARRRLGAKKGDSLKGAVIFDRLAAPRLVAAIADAARGTSVARGVSWLKGSKGAQVLPRDVSILDDPHIPRGLGSRPFDAEGVATARFPLVADGVLQSRLHNVASAAHLGDTATGHAARAPGGAPGVSTSNLELSTGPLSPAQLIAEIDRGLLVEGMFGAQINPNTGAFSVGVYGQWIEGGEIAHPVSEMTVAGDLRDVLLTLTPANDFERRGATNSPSIRLDGLTIAGR